jgi:hypothetical protein
MPDHPIQPKVLKDGIVRFKRNAIVEHLLNVHGHNQIAAQVGRRFSREDYDQLLQLIGYSVSAAPLSPACLARVPEFDCAGSCQPSFDDGFKAGYAKAKDDAIDAIGGLDA